MNKYNIDYSEVNYKNKPIFIFVNHKTAVLCWAKITDKLKSKPNVITFDSHRDYYQGILIGKNAVEPHFNSKYIGNPNSEHFTKCQEFLDWNLLDNIQNHKFIMEQKRFLTISNDNFIDVAFMKNIISNVYWHYIKAFFGGESGKCDDFNDKDHLFIKSTIGKIKKLKKPFILDIDLDFFVKDNGSEKIFFSNKVINKYLILQEKLFSNDLCLGLTVALEPSWCGGEENCLKILNELCKVFGLELESKAMLLISKANSS